MSFIKFTKYDLHTKKIQVASLFSRGITNMQRTTLKLRQFLPNNSSGCKFQWCVKPSVRCI